MGLTEWEGLCVSANSIVVFLFSSSIHRHHQHHHHLLSLHGASFATALTALARLGDIYRRYTLPLRHYRFLLLLTITPLPLGLWLLCFVRHLVAAPCHLTGSIFKQAKRLRVPVEFFLDLRTVHRVGTTRLLHALQPRHVAISHVTSRVRLSVLASRFLKIDKNSPLEDRQESLVAKAFASALQSWTVYYTSSTCIVDWQTSKGSTAFRPSSLDSRGCASRRTVLSWMRLGTW